jgi:hypothetical protein
VTVVDAGALFFAGTGTDPRAGYTTCCKHDGYQDASTGYTTGGEWYVQAWMRKAEVASLKWSFIHDQQIGQLDQEMASLLRQHQHAVERLAEVPGLGVDSAQQIIAEVGPAAATFPSEKCLSSDNQLIVPAEHCKSGRPHVIPISGPLVAIIANGDERRAH